MTDPHERFHLWLTAGAEGDPPRDLAVHASVCTGCRQSIAALDLLAKVDPRRASMPFSAAATERRGLLRAGRLTPAAAGIILSAVILGIGASQLIAMTRTRPAGSAATASPTPGHSVLGSEATAQPSKPSPSSSPETLTPLTSPSPTPQPTSSATPGPTARPTAPVSTPVPTATPTIEPTATPTIEPTATPTIEPTATPTPTGPDAPSGLTASTTVPGEIDLTWIAPADNGSPIIGYDIYRDDVFLITTTSTSHVDSGLGSPESHTYFVMARNSVGGSPPSVTVPGTAP